MQGCRWEEPNPDYKPVIDDFEMLDLIGKRWVSIRANVEPWIETPDKALSKKYSQEAINAKMEELDHRGLLDYGVSLRTAWLTKQGEALLDILRTNDDDLPLVKSRTCDPLILESRPSPFYCQESSRFWFLHFERHSVACPCSYCEPHRWEFRFSWGVSLPIDKSRNAWRMVWAVGREWRYYVRWIGFWKRPQ